MAFRFRRRQSIATEFRRIVREQTATLISLLADQGSDVEERIHQARRELKQLRALFHLVRSAIDEPTFLEENTALREAARQLSKARDAHVALQTFEIIARKLPKDEGAGVRQFLAKRASKARTTSPAQLATIARRVRTSGHSIAEISLPTDGWRLVKPGLCRSFRNTRRMHTKAMSSPTETNLHAWRKDVKRLHAQLELFRRALPKSKRKFIRLLERLGLVLGTHHDFYVLQSSLAEYRKQGIVAAHCDPLDQAVARELKTSLRRIAKLSRGAFSQSPMQFVAAVQRDWKKWHG